MGRSGQQSGPDRDLGAHVEREPRRATVGCPTLGGPVGGPEGGQGRKQGRGTFAIAALLDRVWAVSGEGGHTLGPQIRWAMNPSLV